MSPCLIAGTRGNQIRGDVLSHAIADECCRLGIGERVKEGDNWKIIKRPPPLHGLRKNAVMKLLEVGCLDEEIRAITGQSDAMIEDYGKRFKREKLAERARRRLDEDQS